MKTLYQKKINFTARKRCTLLLPDFLFLDYLQLRNSHGDLRSLLHYLLQKYFQKPIRFFLKNEIAATICYQDCGLNLHREDFRPIEKDWIELKLLAISHNMSICAFFVMLLQMEIAGELDEGGRVPPTHPTISLHQSITRDPIPLFKRYLHLRV